MNNPTLTSITDRLGATLLNAKLSEPSATKPVTLSETQRVMAFVQAFNDSDLLANVVALMKNQKPNEVYGDGILKISKSSDGTVRISLGEISKIDPKMADINIINIAVTDYGPVYVSWDGSQTDKIMVFNREDDGAYRVTGQVVLLGDPTPDDGVSDALKVIETLYQGNVTSTTLSLESKPSGKSPQDYEYQVAHNNQSHAAYSWENELLGVTADTGKNAKAKTEQALSNKFGKPIKLHGSQLPDSVRHDAELDQDDVTLNLYFVPKKPLEKPSTAIIA